MEKITKKLTRYSAAAGALLAVSAGAQANPIIGTILGDDNFLDHHMDFVILDVNNDGVEDFYGIMVSGTSTDTSYYNSNTYTFTYFVKLALFGGASGTGYVELDNYSTTSYFPLLKKFSLNQKIGPLTNANSFGLISFYSSGDLPVGPEGPQAPALGVPFSFEDNGYIGFSFTETPGYPNYGWVNVAIDDEGNVEFISCAMDNKPNTPILAGDSTPVPLLPIASAAGLGLIGLMAALKRRKKSVTL
jgi:hypothetical protein